MKNAHRPLICLALAVAGAVSANAAGTTSSKTTSILSGSSADPSQASPDASYNPYSSTQSSYNSYGPTANFSDPYGSNGGVHANFDALPGPAAIAPFAIGLIAALRRRTKKA